MWKERAKNEGLQEGFPGVIIAYHIVLAELYIYVNELKTLITKYQAKK